MKIKNFLYILTFLLIAAANKIYAEKIIFYANSMKGTAGNKTDSTTLSGQAFVQTETMEIHAEKITLSGKDFRNIEAEGSVQGKNSEAQMEFACGKLTYDRETKIARLKDDVSMTDTKNNVSVKAQIIEYNQNLETAVMQIDVELKQKENICTGTWALYRKIEQMLELSGNSQIKQGKDTFRAQEITLNMESQEITLDGRVKGSIVDERKSDKVEQENQENKSKEPENTENQTEQENTQTEQNENTKETQQKPGQTENSSNQTEVTEKNTQIQKNKTTEEKQNSKKTSKKGN